MLQKHLRTGTAAATGPISSNSRMAWPRPPARLIPGDNNSFEQVQGQGASKPNSAMSTNHLNGSNFGSDCGVILALDGGF